MNFIYNLIATLLPTRSVDGIISMFDKISRRLAETEARQNATAAQLKDQADKLLSRAAAATAEADRAQRVRQRINTVTA